MAPGPCLAALFSLTRVVAAGGNLLYRNHSHKGQVTPFLSYIIYLTAVPRHLLTVRVLPAIVARQWLTMGSSQVMLRPQ